MLGLIATRSIDTPILGLKDLIAQNEQSIQKGIAAYGILQKMWENKFKQSNQKNKSNTKSVNVTEAQNDLDKKAFEENKQSLGYALLLKRYTPNVVDATPEQIKMAANNSIPKSAPLFWTFRVMVGCGMLMLFIFAAAFYYNAKRNIEQHRWLLWLAFLGIPLPWIASECGWFVAEYGRQPWAIGEILPTFLGTSSLSAGNVLSSLTGFIVLYSFLLIVELYLMFKYARLGPTVLGTNRYQLTPNGSPNGYGSR